MLVVQNIFPYKLVYFIFYTKAAIFVFLYLKIDSREFHATSAETSRIFIAINTLF